MESTKKLVKKLNIELECYISDEVVVGNGFFSALSDIATESFIVTEKTPFESVLEYIKKDAFDIKKCCFFDNTTKGEDLKLIIKLVEEDESIKQIVGIGGGRALNYAKFISMKTKKPVITIPTALTTHVYASSKLHADIAIRDLGIERRIDWKKPDLVLIDVPFLEMIQKQDNRLIKSGLGDIMAFISAVEDWKMAHEKGRSDINHAAVDITNDIIDRMGKINVDLPLNEWIKDYAFMQVMLCEITDKAGVSPASGSEHLFANAVERMFENSKSCPLHSEAVALGTLIMAYLQGKDYKGVSRLMKKLKLPTSLKEIGLDINQTIECLYNSKAEGEKKGRYTVLDSLDMNKEYCKKTINYLLNEGVILE